MSALRFRVYDAQGTLQATCRTAKAAGHAVDGLTDGAYVTFTHRQVMWTRGKERSKDSVRTIATRMAKVVTNG